MILVAPAWDPIMLPQGAELADLCRRDPDGGSPNPLSPMSPYGSAFGRIRTGQRAILKKREKVHYLRDKVAACQDQVSGDGKTRLLAVR